MIKRNIYTFILIIFTLVILSSFVSCEYKPRKDPNLEKNIDNLLMIKEAEVEIGIPRMRERKSIEQEDIPLLEEFLRKLYSNAYVGGTQSKVLREWIDFIFYITRPEPLSPYEVYVHVSYNTNVIALSLYEKDVHFNGMPEVDTLEVKETVDYLTTKYRSEKPKYGQQ